MGNILEGIRVVDLTQWIQGPDAAAMLGDLGANVVKVEQLGIGDGQRGFVTVMGVPPQLPNGRNAAFEYFNRNKRSLAIDLKNTAAREIMHRLIEHSDVFLTSYAADDLDKFGLDYATLSKINPKLIYSSASLFGHRGPDANFPGFDQSVLARSGIMMACGDADVPGPTPLLVGLADEIGGITQAFGVVSALMAREKYGIGQQVLTSPFGSLIKQMAFTFGLRTLVGKGIPRMSGNNVPATNRCYQCKDGRWLQLATHRNVDWGPVCEALGLPELENDPEFSDFMKRTISQRLPKLFADRIASQPLQHWVEALRAARVPHSPVNTVDDVMTDPMALENEYIIDYNHPDLGMVKFLGFPWKFSETPAAMSRPAPHVGEHTEEVLIEVGGFTWDDITRLREQGAI